MTAGTGPIPTHGPHVGPAAEPSPSKKRIALQTSRRWGLWREPSPERDPPLSQEENPPPVPAGEWLLQRAPPWLVSLVFHMVVLLMLGLLVLRQPMDEAVRLDVGISDHVGDLLDDESDAESSPSLFSPDVTLPPQSIPADPLAELPPLEVTEHQVPTPRSNLHAPMLAEALSGRSEGRREGLLQAGGGTAATEEAVSMGLEWLSRQQRSDGTWSMLGPYKNGCRLENRPAATAMALLAYLGAGQTPTHGEYRRQIAKGVDALLRMQQSDGSFFTNQPGTHRQYTNAQCTIVVCELLGMTGNSRYRGPAEAAVNYLIRTQAPEGGWRYNPANDADMSVTGWVVMALQSARMAKMDVPDEVFENVTRFLESVSVDYGSRYLYQPHGHQTLAMCAEGLLCRQYLGWRRDDPRLLSGADHLSNNPISNSSRNVYYWYYATQVLHHLGGRHWSNWNAVMRELLPDQQVQQGRERGSWDPNKPIPDQWGDQMGRLYVTCLSIYMLEVYYRHLPLYAQVPADLVEP